VDLNKEIKLSDLFRRKAKDPEAAAGEKAKKPAKERKALFARKEKAPQEPKAPKEPKAQRSRVAAKAGPELPAIPLMRAFNLQPGDDTRERPSRLGLAQVLAALLGLLLIGGLGSAYIFMNARAGDRQAQVEDLRAQLADLEVPAETPATPGDTELLTEGQARTASLAGALQGRVAWDRILREVSLVLPDELYLTQVGAASVPQAAGAAPAPTTTPAATTAPNTMTLAGAAGKQALVALFLSRLETLPEFASVDLQSSAYQEEGDVYVFSITATIAPGGAS
jgi:hypothetical protein